MVRATLGDIFNRIHKVYAANMERTVEFSRARSDYKGISELISKIKIMDLYEYEESIHILATFKIKSGKGGYYARHEFKWRP